MFKVAEKRCAECLFSQDRIVSGKRMADVLKTCRRQDSHFVCHKFTQDDPASQVCCRGFYETQTSQLMRICGRLGAIEFVPLPEVMPLVPERKRRKARA